MRIADTDRGRARDALERAIRFYQDTGNQSFWSFYRLMAGLPLSDSKAIERRVFVNIHDETDDEMCIRDRPAPGAAPERGKFRVAKPGCRGALLWHTFLGQARKVWRP